MKHSSIITSDMELVINPFKLSQEFSIMDPKILLQRLSVCSPSKPPLTLPSPPFGERIKVRGLFSIFLLHSVDISMLLSS
jgi:hypothetical protein